jgi:gentisate 1,2-dioxygenase
MTTPRHIHQTFSRQPGVELRSTWHSTQAYKRHSHVQLSVGAIVEGKTRCVCNGQEYLLEAGDIVVIPAYVPHSCNPVADQPRSYHMLYIDTDLPLAQQVIRDESLFAHYLDIVENMTPSALNALLSALPSATKTNTYCDPPASYSSRRCCLTLPPRPRWTYWRSNFPCVKRR